MPKDIADLKSPPHKIVAFLKNGRDRLRVKYRELREKLRVAENQIRAVSKSRNAWRSRAEAAEAELAELKKRLPEAGQASFQECPADLTVVPAVAPSGSLSVVGSHFNVDIIFRAIRLVTEGALSLRAASRACNIFDRCGGGPGLDAPSQTTIQNHILRLGLYLIERTDQQRTDWIWLLDHTINAGTTKCLVVLAIALEDYRRLPGPLTHQDLTVIALIPVETSNGRVVCGQLERLSTQYGTPLVTLSDRGSDLKKGIELFQQQHPSVAAFYDIVHLVSRFIKSILESDPRWEMYRKACCGCANMLRQSSLAHLKPPRPKTKARYMNYDLEVRWAIRALSILDRVREGRLNDRQRTRLPLDLIEQRLGWLDEYRDCASMWLEVIGVGQAINQTVRRTGYRADTAGEVRRLSDRLSHTQSQSLASQVADEIETMGQQLGPGEAIPGSTEVLESLIGKGKRLLYHGSNSLTRQILSLATTTAKLTTTLIQDALSICRMKHLASWTREHLGRGSHVYRREDLSRSAEELNLRNRLAATTPSF